MVNVTTYTPGLHVKTYTWFIHTLVSWETESRDDDNDRGRGVMVLFINIDVHRRPGEGTG